MKMISLALMLFSATAFAHSPDVETQQTVRALLHSPKVVRALKNANTDTIEDIAIQAAKNGVNEYYIKFRRNCFCMPATADVYINEDLRPTFVDGAPIYTSTVTIKEN